MNRQIPLYDWRVIWGRWTASNLVARGGLREAAWLLEVIKPEGAEPFKLMTVKGKKRAAGIDDRQGNYLGAVCATSSERRDCSFFRVGCITAIPLRLWSSKGSARKS